MAEDQKRSSFAQALYDLMITPGIISIEEWCFYIDPWVTKELPAGGTVQYMSEEAMGKPETMDLIQSWFDDRALPTGDQLSIILDICDTGNEAMFAAVLQGLVKLNDPEYRTYVERYQRGGEIQEKALDRMYQVLDDFARDVTPLQASYRNPLWVIRLSCLVFEHRFSNLHAAFAAVPLRHRQSVFVKLMEDIRHAEESNWYDPEKLEETKTVKGE